MPAPRASGPGSSAAARAPRPKAAPRSPPGACGGCCDASASVVLHRGPQAVLVEAEDVELGLLPGPARHHRLALVVDVEHELGGLLAAVAEQLLEHPRHVGHEVDGVVPHDHDPGSVGLDQVADVRLLHLGRGRGHRRLDAAHTPLASRDPEALCTAYPPARILGVPMTRLARLSLVTTVLTFLAVTAGGLVR